MHREVRGIVETAGRAVLVATSLAAGALPVLAEAEPLAPLTFEIREGFFRELAISSAGGGPAIVSVDEHDTVWTAVARQGTLARFQNGRIDHFTIGRDSRPVGVVAARTGSGQDVIWIAASFDDKLVRFEPATGDVREFSIDGEASWPFNVAVAPTGEVWFTQRASGRVGRLDPESGEITQFDPPTPASGPAGLAVDPRTGTVWFTESYADRIARLDPATGEIHEYVMGDESSGLTRGPAGLAVDAEGGVWFAKLEGRIGYLPPGGDEVEVFDLPTAVRRPAGVAVAGDGSVWVAALDGNQLVRYEPERRHLSIFPIPTGEPDPVPTEPPEARTSRPFGIAVDRRGNVWFSEQYTGQLGVLDISAPAVEILSPGDDPVRTASVLVTSSIEERVSGIAHVQYLVDGRPARLQGGRLQVAELDAGVHTLEVRAVDHAGNEQRVTREFEYRPNHLAVLELLRGLEPRDEAARKRLETLMQLAAELPRRSPPDVEPLRAALQEGEHLFRGFSRRSFRSVLEGIAQGSGRSVEVSILDSPPYFAPNRVEIQAGETVRWSYKPPSDGHSLPSTLHQIEVPLAPEPVRSPPLRAGESFALTFEDSGTFSVRDTESGDTDSRMEVVVR